MTSKSFGIVALVCDGILYGLISDGDLRRNMASLMQSSPAHIANQQPVTVSPDMMAAEALALLNQHKITALFVVDDTNKPIGILNIHDFRRAGLV
jgi:arabinose-5-phosphate isomerase